MKQEIINDVPPIFAEICAVFPEASKPGVIFSWGDKIYNPTGAPIPPQLIVHEAVHGERQLAAVTEAGGPEPIACWWDKYIANPQFRLNEELPAHQAEYKAYCSMVKDRNVRNRYLHGMAVRLAGPLYRDVKGIPLLPYMEAKRLIKG